MKKTITRVFLLLLVLTLSVSMAACDEAAGNPSDAPGGVDFSKYPAKFEEWTIANMKAYMRDAGVFTEDSWCIDVSERELVALEVAGGTMYVDVTGGTVSDIIFNLDTAAESASATLEELRTAKTLKGVPMDALLGNFCFSYTSSIDEEHIKTVVSVIKDLAAHYGLTFEFIAE